MTSLNAELLHRKEVAKKRLEICADCEKYVPATTQCKQCNCVMLIKTIFASSQCPLGKWYAESEINKEKG